VAKELAAAMSSLSDNGNNEEEVEAESNIADDYEGIVDDFDGSGPASIPTNGNSSADFSSLLRKVLSITGESEALDMISDLCATMDMKVRERGSVSQERKVKNFTFRVFSRSDRKLTIGTGDVDIEDIKTGSIVLLQEDVNSTVEELECTHALSHFQVLAVFKSHYNKFWPATHGHAKQKDIRVLLCHVKVLFNGDNQEGRCEDYVPINEDDA